MKRYIYFTVAILCTINTFKASEPNKIITVNNQTKRTIYNSYEEIDQKGTIHGSGANHAIEPKTTEYLDFSSQCGTIRIENTLSFTNGSQDIIITPEHGSTLPGDTIKVTETKKHIKLINERNSHQAKTLRTDVPMIIGTPDNNFPEGPINLCSKLTIVNKDLIQIKVTQIAFGNPSPEQDLSPFFEKNYHNNEKEIRKSDQIVHKLTQMIQKGKSVELSPVKTSDTKRIISVLITLKILEAKSKKIIVNINEGLIKPNDTLKISKNEDEKFINITNQHGTLIAKLYAAFTDHTLVLG